MTEAAIITRPTVDDTSLAGDKRLSMAINDGWPSVCDESAIRVASIHELPTTPSRERWMRRWAIRVLITEAISGDVNNVVGVLSRATGDNPEPTLVAAHDIARGFEAVEPQLNDPPKAKEVYGKILGYAALTLLEDRALSPGLRRLTSAHRELFYDPETLSENSRDQMEASEIAVGIALKRLKDSNRRKTTQAETSEEVRNDAMFEQLRDYVVKASPILRISKDVEGSISADEVRLPANIASSIGWDGVDITYAPIMVDYATGEHQSIIDIRCTRQSNENSEKGCSEVLRIVKNINPRSAAYGLIDLTLYRQELMQGSPDQLEHKSVNVGESVDELWKALQQVIKQPPDPQKLHSQNINNAPLTQEQLNEIRQNRLRSLFNIGFTHIAKIMGPYTAPKPEEPLETYLASHDAREYEAIRLSITDEPIEENGDTAIMELELTRTLTASINDQRPLVDRYTIYKQVDGTMRIDVALLDQNDEGVFVPHYLNENHRNPDNQDPQRPNIIDGLPRYGVSTQAIANITHLLEIAMLKLRNQKKYADK